MKTTFTEQESLSLIAEMIAQARNNFQKGSGNNLIFNGILVSITALLNVALLFVLDHPNQSFWIWCIMIPGALINRCIKRRIRQKAMVETHIDAVITSIWIGFSCATVVLLAVLFGFGFGHRMYQVFFLINPAILIMTGLGEFITAKVCRYKPYFYGAIIMWVGAIVCMAVTWVPFSTIILQMFTLAVCMIFGFVVPGYRLNKAAEDHV